MVTVAPSACAASIVHDFTDSPSTSTVHAPHDDVSQPTLVPVSPHASRRYCTSSVRGSTSWCLRSAVDRDPDLHGAGIYPDWFGPLRVTVIRSSTRRSRTMAAR